VELHGWVKSQPDVQRDTMGKITVNNHSMISVQRVDSKTVDSEGRTYIKTHWEILDKPISFGSINKPQNTDVKRIKIQVADDTSQRDMFSPFFKGFGGD